MGRAGLGAGLGALIAGVVWAQTAAPPAATPAVEPPAASKAPVAPEPGQVSAASPVSAADPAAPADLAPPPAARAVAPDKPAAPLPRSRYDVAILQALDKVTAETLRFEAKVGVPVRWKGLIFTVRACEKSAADEVIGDAIVYLNIDAQPRPQPGRLTPPPKQAFQGWMYASSPGLNPMQHATYDAWAISCRASAPPVVASAAPRPAAKPPVDTPKVLDLPPAAAPPAEAAAPPAAGVPAPKAEPSPRPAAAPPA